MPFVALLPGWSNLTMFAVSVSLGLLLRYAPVLYYGNYDPSVQVMRNWLFVAPIILSVLILIIGRFRSMIKKTA